jgi:exopolyphosphatase/guanosine-5'-triphosphate,3'-diphosphate pyrophosphatase
MKQTKIAAIDLGTNSFHLVVVKLKPGGHFEIIHKQREVVRVAMNRTSVKSLSPAGIKRALNVLSVFKEIADKHNAKIFAVATSAIREAPNQKQFLTLVKEKLNIEINVVSGFEEARLIYLGVLQGLNIYNKKVLLIDIGGGSTELLIGKKGKIEYAASVKLGAVRLTSKFFGNEKKFSRNKIEACRKHVSAELYPILKQLKRLGYSRIIGTAGTVQAIGHILRAEINNKQNEYLPLHNFTFTLAEYKKVANQILKAQTKNDLSGIEGIDRSRVDIITAGTIIIDEIIRSLKIKKITISGYAMREGIIIDAIEKLGSSAEEKSKLMQLRNNSVLQLGNSYNFDYPHALQVKKIALILFDEIRKIHKLSEEARELLEYAALLHDIGYHISIAKHHKHSYYLIKNSEMLGFNQREIEIIANIARYHRKALPKETHVNLIPLSKDDRITIEKLSSLIRLADGLEKTHAALIKDIKIRPNGEEYLMTLRYLTTPPETELWAAEKRKNVLEDVFNIKLKIELEKIRY